MRLVDVLAFVEPFQPSEGNFHFCRTTPLANRNSGKISQSIGGPIYSAITVKALPNELLMEKRQNAEKCIGFPHTFYGGGQAYNALELENVQFSQFGIRFLDTVLKRFDNGFPKSVRRAIHYCQLEQCQKCPFVGIQRIFRNEYESLSIQFMIRSDFFPIGMYRCGVINAR